LFDACIGKNDIYDFSSQIENGLKELGSEFQIYIEPIRKNSIAIVL